jgi:thiamine biosynthesis protein ThiI
VLFAPKHPVLRARVEEVRFLYRALDVDALIEQAFEKREITRYAMRDYIADKWASKAK